MKKLILSTVAAIATLFSVNTSFAQATAAMDFNRADCNGVMRHLFTNDLDSGNVVILEFFMGGGCTSCIAAGHTLEAMKSHLLATHPGKIRSYASGYTNSMNCSTVMAWVSSNGFTSTPIDSGAAQVAYYGGFGMPTIVILAGTTHKVIYTDIGFSNSDTTAMIDSINNFFNPPAPNRINNSAIQTLTTNLFPNPANQVLNLQLQLNQSGTLAIEITDITGKSVSTLATENVVSGSFSKAISVAGLSNGVYIVKATLNGYTSFNQLSIAR